MGLFSKKEKRYQVDYLDPEDNHTIISVTLPCANKQEAQEYADCSRFTWETNKTRVREIKGWGRRSQD